MLPDAWRYRSVGTLGDSNGVVQTGPFGAQLHAEDYVEVGTPFILIKNIRDGYVDSNDMPRISREDATRLAVYALKLGDIVFSRVGRIGSCFLVGKTEAGWIISGQLLRLRTCQRPRIWSHWRIA